MRIHINIYIYVYCLAKQVKIFCLFLCFFNFFVKRKKQPYRDSYPGNRFNDGETKNLCSREGQVISADGE